jgi:hypothetical protein
MSDIPAEIFVTADAGKAALEREKLDLEINRLKHFWRDPDFWIKVTTLTVAVATVWGTVWFSFLGAQVNKLQTDKDRLANDVNVLKQDQTKLKSTNSGLETDKKALTTEVGNLRWEVGLLGSPLDFNCLITTIEVSVQSVHLDEVWVSVEDGPKWTPTRVPTWGINGHLGASSR